MSQSSRILSLVFCTAVLLTALAAPASADCRVRCVGSYNTSPDGVQPSDWGMGSTCAEATTIFQNHARDSADLNCGLQGFELGACNVSFVVTTACYLNPQGQIQIDGYANHSCLVEICIDPIDPVN